MVVLNTNHLSVLMEKFETLAAGPVA